MDANDRDKWRTRVTTVMNFGFQKMRHFMSS